jgi:hypothetical protein
MPPYHLHWPGTLSCTPSFFSRFQLLLSIYFLFPSAVRLSFPVMLLYVVKEKYCLVESEHHPMQNEST